ncbi:beta-lactamase domain-containing protein [Trichoderma breve]|uniref:Beta-lactamase domain-containing protein n=1 Tax=Trichoderma breve TaxID=2034170 RepID=A0A9W9BG94_9HYPO|nr:beta-lactamase domain-containing protein [Trichoderma breve]KAJ4859333.1 beta-lactamase domain-containing protein [Trichoderma breve]
MLTLQSFLVAIAALGSGSLAQTDQTLLGPSFEPPTHLSTQALIQEAASSIQKSLNRAIRTGKSRYGNFNSSTTSFSLTAVSQQEPAPIIDFHHTSGFLNVSAGSTSKVTADTVYRIGSVSKLFTVYSLLLNNGISYWNRPITDFVPELRQAVQHPLYKSSVIDSVQWDQVTVGALASQLSGMGRDYNSGDLSVQDFPAKEAGLPPLPPQDIPTCGINDGQLPCPRKEYFAGLVQRHPVFPLYSKSMYSNAAYRILAYMLEEITGKSYDEVVRNDVFQPLGMKHSSSLPPSHNGAGVIPDGDAGWDRVYGDEVATGGLLSSTNDLVKFGRAIFANKQLSSMETLRWMKPASLTSSQSISVGAPWEIVRTQSDITTGRIVDLYTKSGGVGAYNSLLILIPDYQVTLAILAAGPDSAAALQVATEIAIQTLVPALEKAAKAESCRKHCGKYAPAGAENNSSSLVLTVDDGPGLLLKEWIHQGHDIIAAGQAYANATRGGRINAVRLFPTGLQTGSEAAYRALFETIPYQYNPSVHMVFDPTAGMWGTPDQLMYGGIAADDFVFHLDAGGSSAAVQPRVLREVYNRV